MRERNAFEKSLLGSKRALQGGVYNYLGKQKTVNAPLKWKSSPEHPVAYLTYITKEEADILIKKNIYGSLKDGKPNKGPFGIASLQGSGSGSEGAGSTSGGQGGSEGFSTQAGPGPGEAVGMGETSSGVADGGYSGFGIGPNAEAEAALSNARAAEAEAEENEEEQNIISLMEQDKKDRIAERTKDLNPLGKLAFNQSLLNPFSTTKDIATNVITAPLATAVLTAYDYAQRDTREPGDRSYTDYGYSSPASGGTIGGGGITTIPNYAPLTNVSTGDNTADAFRTRLENLLKPSGGTDYQSNSTFQNFLQSPFYDPKVAGSQVIIPVTLPSGQILNIPNAATAYQFNQYLSSLSSLPNQSVNSLSGYTLADLIRLRGI